jgi:CubicO group peptidase (beta-lactamase class C family)
VFTNQRNRNLTSPLTKIGLRRHWLAVLLPLGLAACGGGGGGDYSSPSLSAPVAIPFPPADYSEVDAAFQAFLDNNETFDGISYVLVDKEGITHQKVFGDHTEDLITMLASTSKVPAVMAIMALDEDESVDFSISEPVSTYLPFEGVYADRTVEQMVSNTSGIPGLRLLDGYGSPIGPTLQDFNHLCQFSAQPFMNFEMCGQMLVQNELPTSIPAGSVFDYGGSQWQIAGLTASIVNNSTWNQLFDEYIASPCGLEVFTFGNPWEELSASGNTYTSFDGATVESMPGQHNPSVEGGGITNLADYAKLLQVHLNGGYCGDTQVLSEASLASMRVDRGSMTFNPTPYGMGWWISSDDPNVYTDPGAFGAVSFMDTRRGIAGFIAIDDYTSRDSGAPGAFLRGVAMPLIQAAVDARYE